MPQGKFSAKRRQRRLLKPLRPLLFNLAINCKVESVLCKGEENPLVRASGFPLPLRSPSFPQRCQRGFPFGNPSLCWIEVLFRADRASRIEPCEPFAWKHASLSHRGMRASRIEACEPLASSHASHSHGAMRASRLRLCFTWIFVYNFTYFFKRSSASRILSSYHHCYRPGGEVFGDTGDDLAGFVD